MGLAAKLPAPPTHDAPVASVSEAHHLVRERSFPPSTSLDAIARELKNSHSTGKLTIDFATGGIGTITFHERKKVTFDDFSLDKP